MENVINVSVIIPHHNRFIFLIQTLNSLRYQTYKDWEAIIVDDYSKLDCIEQIKKMIESFPNIHLITKSSESKGASVSRNMGLDKAKGRYVIFLDADDILAPFALEERIKVFETNREPLDAVVAPTLIFNQCPGDLQEIWNKFDNYKDPLSFFLNGYSYFNTMSGLWDIVSLKRLNGWNEDLSSYQDWELHIRALLNGLLFKEIPEYDNFYRTHSDSQSIAVRFFNDDIAIGRFNAFKTVFSQLKNSCRNDLLKPFRAFVIRNLVQLIDNQKNDLVLNILNSRLAYGLKWYDIKLLIKMMSDGPAWRYRRATKYLTKLLWYDLAFDPWLICSSNQILENSGIRALTYDYPKLLCDSSRL